MSRSVTAEVDAERASLHVLDGRMFIGEQVGIVIEGWTPSDGHRPVLTLFAPHSTVPLAQSTCVDGALSIELFGADLRKAFHGCSADTEPSLATLKYLIDKVEDENVPVVYTIELSSRRIAGAIADTTGAQILTFQSCQSVSRRDFDAGETYLSLMWKNVDALKEGLS